MLPKMGPFLPLSELASVGHDSSGVLVVQVSNPAVSVSIFFAVEPVSVVADVVFAIRWLS